MPSENNIFTLFLIPLAVAIVAMVIEYWIIQPLRNRQENGWSSHSRTHNRFSLPKISPRFLLIFGIIFLGWYGIRWLLQDNEPTLQMNAEGEIVEIIDGTPHALSDDDPRIAGYVGVPDSSTQEQSDVVYVNPGWPGDIDRYPRLVVGNKELGTLRQSSSEIFRFRLSQEQVVNLELEFINGDCFELTLYDDNGVAILNTNPDANKTNVTLQFVAEASQTYLIKITVCDNQGGSYSLQANIES